MRKKILLLALVLTLPVSASEGVVSMSNKYCNLQGTQKISESYHNINTGFDQVENDIEENKTKIHNHINGVSDRHDAEVITYSGIVPGATNVKQAIDNTRNRVEEIITTPSESVSAQEIIDARGGKPALGARLDSIESQLETKAKQEELEELEEQITDIANQLNKNILNPEIESVLGINTALSYPNGFEWDFEDIKIYKNVYNEIFTTFDVESKKPTLTGVTYYVSTAGNNENDGLSMDTPLRSVHAAFAKEDVAEIVVDGGLYTDEYAFNNISGNSPNRQKSIIVRAYDPNNRPVFTTARFYTNWTQVEGKTNVYRVTRSALDKPYDMKVLDEDGDFKPYRLAGSIDEVDSTPGSYYYESNVLYIHTFDSRPADNKIMVQLNLINFQSNGNHIIYFENCDFYGGNDGCISVNSDNANNSNPAIIILNNCKLKYASGGAGGLTVRGYDAIIVNSEASCNYADGFNYHQSSGLPRKLPRAIEINCVGRKNGIGRGTDADNGSTMHDGGKIIRINGEYYNNEGPNVHDINAGTQSWNLGCVSRNSWAVSASRRSNYRIETNGEMWLDSCTGHGSTRQLWALTGKLYIRGCTFLDGTSELTSETIETY